MKKKIRTYLLILLCIFNSHETRPSSLGQSSFPMQGFSLPIAQLPELMFSHPYIATIIAALVYFLSVKRFFFGSSYKPFDDSTNPSAHTARTSLYNTQQPNSLKYDCTEKKLHITFDKHKPITIENVIRYTITKKARHIIIDQFKQRIPVKQIGIASMFQNPDVTMLYSLFQEYRHETLLFNVTTGELIALGRALSVECNEEEDELIVLQASDLSFLSILWNRILAKLYIATLQKTIPILEYKLFHIPTKTMVTTPRGAFKNAHHVTFSAPKILKVINESGESSTFTNGSPTQNNTTNTASGFMRYFLNETNYTYTLIMQPHSGSQEIKFEHISSFYTIQNKKYLIFHGIENARIASFSCIMPDTKSNDLITAIQNNLTKTYIVDMQTGKTIYNKTGVLLCVPYTNKKNTCEDKHNYLYIMRQKTQPISGNISIKHVILNTTNKETFNFNENHILTLQSDGILQLLDPNNKPIETISTVQDLFATVSDIFDETAEKTQQFFNRLSQPFTYDQKTSELHCLKAPLSNLSYDNYMYVTELPTDGITEKMNVAEILSKGIRGLVWNLYNFKKRNFNTQLNTLEGFSDGTICLCNQEPEAMQYFTYQSLKKELSKIITFMQKAENKHEIITLFLKNNDCDLATIDTEISSTLGACSYNPLFIPTNTQKEWPTLEKMITENKRLIVFNTTNQQSKTTHSIKRAPLTSLSFCHTEASKNPLLLNLARQANEKYIKQ